MQNPNQNNDRVFFIYHVPTPLEYSVSSFEWAQLKEISESDISNITLQSYEPKEKDKLYFYPGCDVPRYKVRSWAESIKGSVTIKLENATAKFASKTSLISCTKRESSISAPKDMVMNWLSINYPMEGSAKKLYDDLSNSPQNVVHLRRQSNWTITTGYSVHYYQHAYNAGYKQTLHELGPDLISFWTDFTAIEVEKEHVFNDLTTNPTVYSQESLIKIINSNSAIIDAEMFNTLVSMFKSTNSEDQVTAMSIMASCNLEQSLHYILFLLDQFGTDVILNMKERNHVNFKSMLEYIGEDRWWKMTIEKQMGILMSKGVLTFEMLKEFAEAIKQSWIERTQNKYFTIKTIEATDEVKNYFKHKATQQN